MKRLLVVANDRAFTRFVGESLVGRSLDAFMPRPDDPWDVARAHSALEAEVLVTRGRRRFHAIIIDRELRSRAPLDVIRALRRLPRTRPTPIFLVTERGHDPHTRRAATEELDIAGFMERPVSIRTLQAGLELLERSRRLLLVERDPETGRRYATAFERERFDVITASTREGALRALKSFDPDVVAVGVAVDGHGGLEVCADIKKTDVGRSIPVALYGQLRAIPREDSNENALRADDFVQAPFDDGVLIERVVGLVGRGAIEVPGPGSDSGDDDDQSSDLPTSPGMVPASGPSSRPLQPPVSASPASVGPTQRQTRRVPCTTSLRILNGETLLESHTLDISHGGLYFELDPPLPIGTFVEMKFVLPEADPSRPIEATGRVAWTSLRGVGVKFSRIEKDDLHLIVDYVNRVSRLLYSSD